MEALSEGIGIENDLVIPEKKMLTAMVLRAVMDAIADPIKEARDGQVSERAMKDAKNWLFYGDIGRVTFDYCLEHISEAPEGLRKKILNYVYEHISQEAA